MRFRASSYAMITKNNNNRNMSAWSLENGYQKKFTDHEYPFRVFDSDQKSSLILMLSSYDHDRDNLCALIREGFNIYISVPGESLESTIELRADLSKNIKITVKSKIVTTSKALRTYEPSQRGCFFNSERQLRFFKIYTAHNCIIECLANYTKAQCGCVKFSMPSMH